MKKEVLEVLEKDAKASLKQISAMTGLSVKQVRKTIEEAEKDRTIVKYKTMVNWEKVGEERVQALIEVKIQPQKDVGFDAIAERIYRFPEVNSLYLVSGAYALAHFFLKPYKQDGVILEREEKVRREPLTL
jgi:DNA-binding Lrp family transcriptional regulator